MFCQPFLGTMGDLIVGLHEPPSAPPLTPYQSMEVVVSIPSALYTKIEEHIDCGEFAHRRELVESALEYFLHAQERVKFLSLKPEELTEDERGEYNAFYSDERQIELLRLDPEHNKKLHREHQEN